MGGYSGIYLDKALSNVSAEFQNSGFAASEVFKRVPVTEMSGRIWVGGFERFHQFNTQRQVGDVAREMPPSLWSNLVYYCQKHDLRKIMADDEIAMSPGFDIEVTTTEELMDAIFLDIEFVAYNLVTGGAVPSATLTGGNQWSDFTNSDPIAAVEAQRTVVHLGSTRLPNVFGCGIQVWSKLRQHPKIIDRFKYTELADGYASTDQLRRVFGVDKMIVLEALYDTAAFGLPPSLGYIWGKLAFLAFIPDAPARRTPSLGYSYWLDHVTGPGGKRVDLGGDRDSNIPGGGPAIFRYRDEARQGEFLEARSFFDVELVRAAAAYVWLSAVS